MTHQECGISTKFKLEQMSDQTHKQNRKLNDNNNNNREGPPNIFMFMNHAS